MIRSEVLDRAINEHPFLIDAGHPRHERRRAGRQHNGVVPDLPALRRDDHPALAVDGRGTLADVQADAVFGIPPRAGQLQMAGIAALEVLREVDAIVGGAGLLAERHDLIALVEVVLHQPLAEPVADHPIADHHDGLPHAILGDHWSGLPIAVVCENRASCGVPAAGCSGSIARTRAAQAL